MKNPFQYGKIAEAENFIDPIFRLWFRRNYCR